MRSVCVCVCGGGGGCGGKRGRSLPRGACGGFGFSCTGCLAPLVEDKTVILIKKRESYKRVILKGYLGSKC